MFSHLETETDAGNTVKEAPLVLRDVDKQTIDTFEEAPLIVRGVDKQTIDVLAQLQESNLSPRLEKSYSQVMKNNAQSYGKNDVQINPEDKKFLNFPEEMPLPIPSLFLKCSVPCPTSVKTPGNPEPKALNTLEMFVREMERAVEHAQVGLGRDEHGLSTDIKNEPEIIIKYDKYVKN